MNIAEFYEEVGRRIFKARKGRLTQEQLADRVELKRTSITNIEKGRQRIMLHTLFQIAEALGVTVDELCPQASEENTSMLEQALKSHPKKAQDWVKRSVSAAKKGGRK